MKTISQLLNEARPTQLIKAMGGILTGKFFTKRIEVFSTTNGMVGAFRGEDGNLYTVEVSAIVDSRHKNLFTKYMSKKK